MTKIDSLKNELDQWITEGAQWMKRGKLLLEQAQKGNSRLTTCVLCDKNFMPKREDAMYCSNACKKAANRLKHSSAS